MSAFKVNLSAFVRYMSAGESKRRAKAVEIRDQADSEYFLPGDFWKQMRVAIYNDRRTMRDGSVIEAAAAQASAKRRASYATIAELWPSIAERWNGARFHRPASVDLLIGGLDVAVKPLFSEEWPDGTIEHVAVWMNLEAPSAEAVQGALRLLLRADTSGRAIATFVDVRRGNAWSSTVGSSIDLDKWLEGVGARLLADANG
ncbi:MAG: hypothetical protein JWP19_2197 [Rhodoglobus sp.]|nr:hypothetical protein [Rhodoglobus sp.]